MAINYISASNFEVFSTVQAVMDTKQKKTLEDQLQDVSLQGWSRL